MNENSMKSTPTKPTGAINAAHLAGTSAEESEIPVFHASPLII